MTVSEKLGLPVEGRWAIKGHPSGYLGLLKQWFDHFGLEGPGLLIGESGAKGRCAKEAFLEMYPNSKPMTVDLKDAEIIWDITRAMFWVEKVDWIVCQATLEHVKDPVEAVRALTSALIPGGRLFLHTHGPAMKYHRHPIDCYRFFRDALLAFGEFAGLEILDLFWEPRNCFAAYEKRK